MTTTTKATTTTTKATTTTTKATTTGISPSVGGRPDRGAAGSYVAELFTAHGRMVLGLCRLLLRDPVEAEDAAQQVFLSAHRSVLDGVVPREPAAWLAAIARNECRARARTRMRRPLELSELPDDLPDPLARAIDSADLEAIWTALSELPRRQRRAFLLRELGGLSYGELGVALGVSRPAIESLLFRARQQLRDVLAGVNVALVPLALREQLMRLIPGFTPQASPVPVAAKVAAVAVGMSLGAAGAVELPKHHGHPGQPAAQREQAPDAADIARHQAALAAVTKPVTQVTRAVEPRHVHERHDEEGRAEHRRGEDRAGADDGAEHVEQRQEAQHEGDLAAPERHSGGDGGRGDGGGHDGGSSEADSGG